MKQREKQTPIPTYAHLVALSHREKGEEVQLTIAYMQLCHSPGLHSHRGEFGTQQRRVAQHLTVVHVHVIGLDWHSTITA